MKKLAILSALVLGCFAFFAFTINGDGEFKNLKVLPKNISKDDLDSTMKHYAKSLGVKCGFCHERNADGKFDYASDKNKHKEITRDMMKMTNKLNKKYFDNELDKKTGLNVVTCFSCHNGLKKPATKPPADPDDE